MEKTSFYCSQSKSILTMYTKEIQGITYMILEGDVNGRVEGTSVPLDEEFVKTAADLRLNYGFSDVDIVNILKDTLHEEWILEYNEVDKHIKNNFEDLF